MERNDDNMRNSDYTAWSDKVERVLLKAIMLLAILLCLSQFVLQFPAARHWITTTDDSEGVPFHYVAH